LLRNALLSVFDSISLSQTRPELGGIFIKFDDSKIFFVSTDSFRLTERIIEISKSQKFDYDKNLEIIIPRNTITELIRILNESDEDIIISVKDNQIKFNSYNFEIISRLIDGRYPDYQKVIPSSSISRVFYKKEDLINQVRLASIFSSNINDIRIVVDKNETFIFAQDKDKGEFVSKIKNIGNKDQIEKFDISLNYNYLIDGLKNIPSEEIIFEYVGEGAPLVLKPKDKDFIFTYLIMPLKV